jgi:hypothetical protein
MDGGISNKLQTYSDNPNKHALYIPDPAIKRGYSL